MNNEQLKFEELETENLTPIETIINDEGVIIEDKQENIFLIEEEPPAPKKETRGRPKKPIEKKEIVNNTILGDDE